MPSIQILCLLQARRGSLELNQNGSNITLQRVLVRLKTKLGLRDSIKACLLNKTGYEPALNY